MSIWHMDIYVMDAVEYIDINDCASNKMLSRMMIEVGFDYEYSSFDYMLNKPSAFGEIRDLFKS